MRINSHTRIDTEELYAEVASEAFDAMNAAMNEYRNASPLDRAESDYDDCEVYLYVFTDGRWTIDHAQYIPTTNGCISNVPIGSYSSVSELAEDMKANEDWDAVEDAEGDDDAE